MRRFVFIPGSLIAILLWLVVASPRSASAGGDTVLQYYPNGAVHFEIQIDAGRLRHGWTREFEESGRLTGESMYEHGVREGISRLYYNTGELMTVWMYEDGRRHGQSIGHYRDGAIKDRGFYKDDRLHGPVTLYYPDGTVKAQLEFADGRRTGESRTFYEDGQVEFVYRHENGRMVYSEHYGRDGQLQQKQHYPLTRPR